MTSDLWGDLLGKQDAVKLPTPTKSSYSADKVAPKATPVRGDTIASVLGDLPDDPVAEWWGMPAFEHEDLTAFHKVVVHFKSREDVDKFANLIGQEITEDTRSLWYPATEIRLYGIAR